MRASESGTVKDEARAPICAAINERQVEERRREDEARRHSEAESRLRLRLSHVGNYLGELEFDGLAERWKTRDKLKEIIHRALKGRRAATGRLY